jgi:hypothetical protein
MPISVKEIDADLMAFQFFEKRILSGKDKRPASGGTVSIWRGDPMIQCRLSAELIVCAAGSTTRS